MSTQHPVEQLFRSAESVRMPMSRICDHAGVARSTPSRWRKDPDQANMKKVNALKAALAELVALDAGPAAAEEAS